jgi:hypothetical protein
VALLRIKLAGMHDPEHLGLRVLCELLGVPLGIGLGWLVAGHAARHEPSRGAPPMDPPSS